MKQTSRSLRFTLCLLGVLFLILSDAARQVRVVKIHNSSAAPSPRHWRDYYNTITDVSAELIVAITPAELSNADLFISETPANPYSAAQLDAMADYVRDGGRILFLGDTNSFPVQNGFINAAILEIGGAMQLGTDSIAPGCRLQPICKSCRTQLQTA